MVLNELKNKLNTVINFNITFRGKLNAATYESNFYSETQAKAHKMSKKKNRMKRA